MNCKLYFCCLSFTGLYGVFKISRYLFLCISANQGGLPAWLLKKKDIVLRSTDSGEKQKQMVM